MVALAGAVPAGAGIGLRRERGRVRLRVRKGGRVHAVPSASESNGEDGLRRGNSVAPGEVQALFNGIAPVYDVINDAFSLGQHRVWKRATVKWSGAKKGAMCLDLCCGSGDLALLLAEYAGPSGRVTGLDFSRELLDEAEKRAGSPTGRLGAAEVEWVEGDAMDLGASLPAGVLYDAATMGYGLRNVRDIVGCLRGVHSVLRPGATLACLDFNRPEDAPTQAFQTFALDNLVVPFARALNLGPEYEYLVPSIARFPTGPEQVQLALDAGFSKARHYMLANGLMGVLVATK